MLIFGMGMMGASLARALRDTPAFTGRVSGVVRSERSAATIREMNIADEVFRLSDSAPDRWPDSLPSPAHFDLIVLGMPVRSARACLDLFGDFAGVVTDMSSTAAVARRAAELPGLRFVGSHPMCGSEDTGPGAARPGLFQGRLCLILDPYAAALPPNFAEDREAVESLWRAVGMQIFRMDANRHDEVLAFLSHGPHLISGLLTRWARSRERVRAAIELSPRPITGGGFKDMARIAGSNPEMWFDILDTNREMIRAALALFRDDLNDLIERMDRGAGDDRERDEWFEWFRQARADRDFLCNQ